VLLGWVRIGARIPGASLRPVEVNGTPGALLLDGEGRLLGVWALEIAGDQIVGLESVINPEKLGHLGPLGDVHAVLRAVAGRRDPGGD
jgi:RNA polymerase sigma-70 factor (ECF subfamily)